MYHVKAFGQVRDIVGSEFLVEERMQNVRELKDYLVKKFPDFSWGSIGIAVNKQLASDTSQLMPKDEIALIPPVSGG